ncbi:MAG TPA: nickel-binding protein [Crinalium sp.]
MALIVVETTHAQPLTPEIIEAADERVFPCLKAREADWRYSLISTDWRRTICTFDAPDTEAVRSSYRMANIRFDRMWPAEIRVPEFTQPSWKEPILKVVESTYPSLTDEDWDKTNGQILPYYAEHGIEWVCSYVSRDRTRLVWELNASDADVIQAAHRKFGIPCDRVWSANVLKP